MGQHDHEQLGRRSLGRDSSDRKVLHFMEPRILLVLGSIGYSIDQWNANGRLQCLM